MTTARKIALRDLENELPLTTLIGGNASEPFRFGLRSWTGADIKASEDALKRAGGNVFTEMVELLALFVVTLDYPDSIHPKPWETLNTQAERVKALGALPPGDVMMMWLTMRRINYGSKYALLPKCAACGAAPVREFDIGDIEMEVPERPESMQFSHELEVPFTYGKGESEREVTVLHFRAPCFGDLSGLNGKSVSVAEYVRTGVVGTNIGKVQLLSIHFDKMAIADCEEIDLKIVEAIKFPDLNHEWTCSCGHENRFDVAVAYYPFFKSMSRRFR